MINDQTAKLRKLLDERGIEYAESQDRFRTRFRFNYCEACGDYLNEIEVMGACITASKSYLTPEQAIAAILGSDCYPYEQRITGDGSDWGEIMRDAYDDLMANACESCTSEQMEQFTDYIRANLKSGTLTVEQVRECLQDVYYEGYGDGFVNRGAHINEIDWQRIADELNAELKNDPYDAVSCEHVISSDTLHLILDEWDIHPGWTATNENMAQLFNRTTTTFGSECEQILVDYDELINTINELQKKQPYCYNPETPLDTLNTIEQYIDELIAERDEWKAKSAKRAAAVERLKNSAGARFSPDAIVCALLDGRCGNVDWSLECDAILDLLTDDDGVARSNDGVTNLEWYAKNDLEKLRDLGIDGSMSCYDCPNQCVETEEGTPPEECQRRLLEWLMAPYEDAHSKAQSKTEPTLSEQSESLSDEADSREKLDYGDAIQFIRENVDIVIDQLINDELHDSREKLEAEILDAGCADEIDYDRIIGWLNRQAAITERECLERAAKSDWLGQHLHAVIAENRELQDKLTDLNAERGGDASVIRFTERLHDIADEMRNVGASTMTPHELLACYAREVDKVADSLMFAAKLERRTCELHDCDGSFSAINRPVWRCDCGAFMTQYTDVTTYYKPRFCPNCGRQVMK